MNIITSSEKGADGKAKRKTFGNMVLDALIIGAIATAAVMGNAVPTQADLWVMLKAFGIAFFTQLAIERGLKRG